ncbi:hypothetical protein [Mycobacterium sp. AZCC_0083]|uniref:hypothetical protein n=1 Tax=Mycobacterium sp. AZCC_0083 TaxID=2735882 RepID=UPI00160EFD60|nr:hypothetical protein [Mycobacterium sp. AZCC_0083]MBB5166752.1 hypothetical protein [Mycobacterium sp. AZCC_0083]
MTTDHSVVAVWCSPQLIQRRPLRGNAAHHPVVPEEAERRSQDIQLRLADRITTFELTRQIHLLTTELHRRLVDTP